MTSPIDTPINPPSPHGEPDLRSDMLAHLRQLEAGGSPGLAKQVLEIFLRDTVARLANLREALGRRDADAARVVAHTLHGSASAVGAVTLERGCFEILGEVRRGSFDRCEALVTKLDADFTAIRRAVTEWMADGI